MRDPYGLRRVLEPAGVMPQPAWRLDNTMVCGDDEILIDVDTLNIDAASFAQIKSDVGADADLIGRRMLDIVAQRGKHHNPVTGSGGMLIGRVREIGRESSALRPDGLTATGEMSSASGTSGTPRRQDAASSAAPGAPAACTAPPASASSGLAVGDRIATLVSLSLTPLTIRAIRGMDLKTGQVAIEGQAILFDTGLYVTMPDDLPDRITLAVCDVCGAPAQTARLVRTGQTVAVLGAGGKSGSMVLAQARRNLGATGRLVAVEYDEKSAAAVRSTGYADDVLVCDATQPVSALAAWQTATGGDLADLTINCVSVSGTELASILITRDRGLVYFFSMATSFTTAALGAEGVGKDVDMMIGNGYARGHAQLALDLLRTEPPLRELFAAKIEQSTSKGMLT